MAEMTRIQCVERTTKKYITLHAQHHSMLEKSFHELSCWYPNCPLSRQRWLILFFKGDYWGGQTYEVICPWSQNERGTPGQDTWLWASSPYTLICRLCQQVPICSQHGTLVPIFPASGYSESALNPHPRSKFYLPNSKYHLLGCVFSTISLSSCHLWKLWL